MNLLAQSDALGNAAGEMLSGDRRAMNALLLLACMPAFICATVQCHAMHCLCGILCDPPIAAVFVCLQETVENAAATNALPDYPHLEVCPVARRAIL